METQDRIVDIFKDKSILITGVTGFVGKVLLEKLLRSCLDIKRIFVLIRQKYNCTPEQRLQKLFKSSLFDLVKSQRGENFFKQIVVAIHGDISHETLGLTKDSRHELIDYVEIIYHSAAQLRFDETLKTSVLMNVRGTKLLLDLARSMKKLQVFCHISTAYCHPQEDIMYEIPYEPIINPFKLITFCEGQNDYVISALTHKILQSHPNTYCFTKALSEGIINTNLESMPIILLRPSLILPALKEPIPGWTDTINGTLGFQLAAGKGILRTIYTKTHNYPDLIPVDIAVNAFLCATFDFLKIGQRQIYNITSSEQHRVSWKQIIDIGKEVITNSVPLNWVIWYPGGSPKSSKFVHNCVFYLQHVLPSLIVDFERWIFNYPPILLPIYRRIQKGFDIIEFYHCKSWKFDNRQARAAREELSTFERQKYNIDGQKFDYLKYFENCTLCARRYILNEPDDTLPRAKQHLKFMYVLDIICKTLLIFYLLSFLSNYIWDIFNYQ